MAQDEESNSFIVNLIQDSLSSENRQIRLRGIDGLLASDASVEEITVSDQEGVWLTIKQADIVWTRRALLTGRLKIDSLKAEAIEITRAPLPDPSPTTIEAQPFSLPELPVSVEIGALDIPKISLAEPLLGQSAELNITGSFNLIDGSLDSTLELNRLDRRGLFKLIAAFENASRDLKIDVSFDEAEDGIIANLLKIEGRPALELSVIGEGPLEDIDLTLAAKTDGSEAITGKLELHETASGIQFDADVSGALSSLIAPTYRSFFDGESTISAVGVARTGGGFNISDFALETAALKIAGDASTTNDGFLRRAVVTGTLGNGQSQTVLPFGDGISVRGAELDISFGEDPRGLWEATLTGDNLIAGEISSREFNLLFQGTADGIETPAARRLVINANGDLNGLRGSSPDLSRALGQRLIFQLASNWEPGKYTIDRARFGGAAARIELEGEVADLGFQGDVTARIDRLAPFGGAVGRDLQGAVDLKMSGQIQPLAGSFDLTLDGTSEALKLDIPSLDALLIGTTELEGRILRNETGFRTQNVALSNRQIKITSDGVLATDRADLDFNATLTDLRILTNRATGQVNFSGSAKGDDGTINLISEIEVQDGTLLDKPLEALSGGFDGVLRDGELDGQLVGTGRLDGSPISLSADLATQDSSQSLNGLRFSVGPTRLTGDLNRQPDGLMNGALDLNSPDISLLAALFLQEAKGRANARLGLAPNVRGQQVTATGNLSSLSLGGVQIGTANLDSTIENALGVPEVSGNLNFADAIVGGVEIETGSLTADGQDKRTDFQADLELTNETKVTTAGALTETDAGYDLELSTLSATQKVTLLELEKPSVARITPQQIDVDSISFVVGDGRIKASGFVNGGYDVVLEMDNVPLSMANAFREDLGLRGELSGNATLGGPRDAPDLNFDLAALGVSASALANAELPAFDLTAKGTTTADQVNLAATLTGPQSLDSTIDGTVQLDDLSMDLAGKLNAFPLALIDGATGGQGLRGNITGQFNLLGTPTKPRINFDLGGRNISLRAMRENAIAPLSLSTNGSFVNDVITLPETRVIGADSTNFTISGRIPLRLDGLNAAASGTLPLSVMNVALARNGLAATGTANLSLRASGSLTAPNLSGSTRLTGGTFISSTANVRLEDVNINANFSGNRLNLTNASARNSRGGTIEADGFVTVDPVAGFPVNLSTTVRNLRYTDGRLATALANGNLSMTGALMRRSKIEGQIAIEELEFSLPQQLGTKKAYSLDVQHVNLTPRVRQTLSRAGISEQPERAVNPDSDIEFDVTVNAPNKVFVRGRGVDAELGGALKLGGTTRNLKPIGQFNLIRGRINILARRIELDEGFIQLRGTLDPELYLRARTVADDVEANVSLEGPASKPVLEFSSVPDLPDDEVLARLVFDRSLADLSALQVAQLASAAGELSGRTGPSFFSQLRDATGLDDLDFETDNQGTTTVRVGKYIQDNIYSSIEADNQGSSRATINLDINQNFTAKGTLDNQGNTSFGIFFERDY